MMGQLVYLVVAMVYTAIPALVQFRWRINTSGGDNYYALWDTNAAEWGATNYWKIAYQVQWFGLMAIFGTLSLTSILAFAGIAADVNLMAWSYLAGVGLTAHQLVFQGLLLFIMIKMSAINSDATKTTVADAGNLMTEIQSDWATLAGAGAFAGAILSMNYSSWKFAMDEAIAKAAAKAEEQPEEEAEAAVEEEVVEEEVPAELFHIDF